MNVKTLVFAITIVYNTNGSYECSCRDGYELEYDGRCLGNKSTL